MTNKLYYGDNLDILRDHIADASVDLIYLDPPFNSNAGYNVLFKAASGASADASIEAFDDTWTWATARRRHCSTSRALRTAKAVRAARRAARNLLTMYVRANLRKPAFRLRTSTTPHQSFGTVDGPR